MSLFFTAYIHKERGIKKSFGRQKCWEQRSRSALFLSGQRAKHGTLSYPSTDINLPFKNKGTRRGHEKRMIGEAENREKGRTGRQTNHTLLQRQRRIPISVPLWYGKTGRKRTAGANEKRLGLQTERRRLFRSSTKLRVMTVAIPAAFEPSHFGFTRNLKPAKD